jgi:hypothetical protein
VTKKTGDRKVLPARKRKAGGQEAAPARKGKTGCREVAYDPALGERVLALMAEGASQAEVARELGVSRSLWYAWIGRHPEFAAVVEEGLWRAQGWWERQGRVSLGNREFNHVLWMMNVKNRFPSDWRDRHEVAATHQLTLADLVAASLEGLGAPAKPEG